MTSIHETAYPRFKPELTQRELVDVYTPTDEEHRFARRNSRSAPARLYIILLLKTVQRLGYFPMLADMPAPIVSFLSKSTKNRSIPTREIALEERSDVRQRFMEAIRSYLGIKPVTAETDSAIQSTATEAAQTKQELADIINVIIEELIRQRFELPAFSTLNRKAQKVRNQVNDRYFCSLSDSLPVEVIDRFDAMLASVPQQALTGWQQRKLEPKKPTNTEVRQYLEHIGWLKSWATELPAVDHIPVVKRSQYIHEARALDASDMKSTQPAKRYALMVLLFHAQLSKALDDAVGMFIRKLRKIHTGAELQLQQYYLDHQKRAEKLIAQLRDVLEAFQEGETDAERGERIAAAFHDEPGNLLIECDERIAYAGNNYLPFMLAPYQTQRPLLLNCLGPSKPRIDVRRFVPHRRDSLCTSKSPKSQRLHFDRRFEH